MVDKPNTLNNSADMGVLLTAIAAERARQDQQWGGPEHDDTHNANDWLNNIQYQWGKAAKQVTPTGVVPAENIAEYRERMVKVMALAVAALQSLNRLSAATPPAPGAMATDDYIVVNLEVLNINVADPDNIKLEVRERSQDFSTAFGRNMRANPIRVIEGNMLSAPDGSNIVYNGEQFITARVPRHYAEENGLGAL